MVDDDLQIIYACCNVSVFTPVSSEEFSIRWYQQNFPLYFFAHFIRLFVTIFDYYMVPRCTVQSSNIFLGFIISSIVIIGLKNSQKLSKNIIPSRIVHVKHQFKIAATPSVAWSPSTSFTSTSHIIDMYTYNRDIGVHFISNKKNYCTYNHVPKTLMKR